jgi:hypothetical protein
MEERKGNLKLECGVCSLQRSEYSNLKLAEATTGRGLGNTEEV